MEQGAAIGRALGVSGPRPPAGPTFRIETFRWRPSS